MIVYDFNQPDLEDGLQRKRGLMTPPDRVSILITLVFGLVMVGGLLTLQQTLLDSNFYVPAIGALLLVKLCPRLLGDSSIRLGQLPGAFDLLLVKPLVTVGAGVSAFLLLKLGSQTRLQPLRTPVRVFCFSFVAFLSIDILLGQQLGAATVIDALAWNPYRATLLGKLVGLLPVLLAWIVVHVGSIFLLSTFVTGSEILLERGFRPRISESSAQSPCIHLSDLHVTANGADPIQNHGLSVEELLKDLRSKVAAANGPIALTGDITDAGTREEWRLAIAAIEAGRIGSAKAVPVLLVPGNHDLFPYMQEFRPTRSALGMGSRLVPLRKLRFLEAAARLCPQLRVADERETLLIELLTANGEVLRSFAAGEHSRTKMVNELWDSCFPLHCVIGMQAFIILDTNRPAMSFISAAFGEVATQAWSRLDKLLLRFSSRPTLQVVVLGHHHIYTPLENRSSWLVKWLEIVSRHDLLKLLSRNADFYIHGHRHVAFKFKVERLNIVSSGSMRESKSA